MQLRCMIVLLVSLIWRWDQASPVNVVLLCKTARIVMTKLIEMRVQEDDPKWSISCWSKFYLARRKSICFETFALVLVLLVIPFVPDHVFYKVPFLISLDHSSRWWFTFLSFTFRYMDAFCRPSYERYWIGWKHLLHGRCDTHVSI
jgi:hypothetical protein